jgi:membrane protease YdiL (CAAX protease family)
MTDNNNNSFPKPIEAFLVIIASFFFVVLIIQAFIFLFMPNPQELSQSSTSMKILITFGELGLIVIPLMYIKRKQFSFTTVFRWNVIPWKMIIWSIVIGFCISFIGDEMDRLVNLLIPAPEFLGEITEALQIQSFSDFVVLFIGAVLAAAFVEESIIRGFLQISLEKHQDVTRAVIYASLAWTIIHGMLYWAIQIFLLGIILGLLAWRSNSIVPSFIGHAINNAMALLFYNVDQRNFEGIYLWGDHVSPLILILAIAGLIYGIRAFYQHYQQPPKIPFTEN